MASGLALQPRGCPYRFERQDRPYLLSELGASLPRERDPA